MTPGEQVKTKSGRLTEPVPKGPSSRGNRAIQNALNRLDTWLLKEGILEASALGNEWLVDIYKGINPKRMTEAEREGIHDTLGFPL